MEGSGICGRSDTVHSRKPLKRLTGMERKHASSEALAPASPSRGPGNGILRAETGGGGPERNGRANSDGAPPRHEDRAGDRIAPTRSGRQVGRADRRHWVVAAYRASRADRPSPSRLRRPPGAWRNRPRLGLPRRRDSRGQRVIPMRPSPKSLTRRPINSAAEPHGRTAAGSLDQNDSVATRRVVDEGVRSCPRAGCGRSARPVVCPAKAGMFSRRKACRGKS